MARTGKPTLLVRLIGAADALVGGTRLVRAADALLGGSVLGGAFNAAYKGARIHRGNRGAPMATRSVKQEIKYSLRSLRARARDLSRNTAYAVSFRNLLLSNVIGPDGIHVKSQVRDARGELMQDVNEAIDESWNRWASKPVTIDRKLDLVGALALILETECTDGELLVRMITGAENPHGFALQLIDADLMDERFERTRGPQGDAIEMSVQADPFGAPVGYHVYDRVSELGYPVGAGRTFYRAWNPFTFKGDTLHPHLMHRPNQYRGISWFHAAIEQVDSVDGYTEAVLFGARLGASSSALISPADDADDDPRTATPPEEIEASTGTAYLLRAGDKVNFWDPKMPPGTFNDFLKAMGKLIGMSLGAPYYALTNDLESANFSSMRGGELMMKPIWKGLQRHTIAQVLQPIREAWINAAILSGELKLPSIDPTRYRAARYRGRGSQYVNPLDEIRAYALAIQCGLISRQRILAETTGEEAADIIKELALESEKARELDVSIDPPASVGAQIAISEALSSMQAGGGSTDGSGNGGRSLADVPESIRRRLLDQLQESLTPNGNGHVKEEA